MKKRAIFIVAAVFLATGCKAEVTEDNLSHLHFVKYSDIIGDKSQEERAAAIKRRLKQIEEISGSAVVVEGHTAIIGLRVKDDTEDGALSRVRREAEAAAKEADAYTHSTSITTNGRIVALIEEMERRRAG
ncbi:MAG: YhcN/YlaJ family sporulation lipoprotein [Anaerotignum sp.]|nr:YhcN/YlaJ family sporulation lipoprotein [Anaerotignum sp.]